VKRFTITLLAASLLMAECVTDTGGGVYFYYEFWVPRDQRLTDEEWRLMLAAGTQPERPEWASVFLVEEP
jgi:hypothetical protein